ncbi:MAG: lipoate--protein ligase family protein [Elusimicrobia bacterium]|nr:lipoate--protein ligase family protein [Elusimicrobiota bacterium]
MPTLSALNLKSSSIMPTVNPMRLLCDPPGTMTQNMAIDRLLFDNIKQGQGLATIRIYSWSEPCVTVGFGIAIEKLPKTFSGVPAMKRPTGGGVVYHHNQGEITIAQTGPRQKNTPVNELYRLVHEPIAWALRELGHPIELLMNCGPKNTISPSPNKALPSCFSDAPCLYDGLLDGRKVLGGGLRLAMNSFLYQGTIKIENLTAPMMAQTLIACPILSLETH